MGNNAVSLDQEQFKRGVPEMKESKMDESESSWWTFTSPMIEESRKPILCLDFDGVVHSYASGWKGADVIPDPPVPGALHFMVEATKHFRVCIFSSRSHQSGGIEAMIDWLYYWSHTDEGRSVDPLGKLAAVEFPAEKPAALVSIDDRAIQFDGTWPEIASLLAFKPWNKR